MLQGCPPSGALFAAAVDAVLRHLASIVEVTLRTRRPRDNPLPLGIVAACADDIGGSFASIRIRMPMCGVFGIVERVSNLKVEPKKCVVVRVHEQPTLYLCQRISEWIKICFPEWDILKFTAN